MFWLCRGRWRSTSYISPPSLKTLFSVSSGMRRHIEVASSCRQRSDKRPTLFPCCRGACVTLHKNMFSPRSKPKVAAMADTVCRTSDSTDSELDEEDPRPFLFFFPPRLRSLRLGFRSCLRPPMAAKRTLTQSHLPAGHGDTAHKPKTLASSRSNAPQSLQKQAQACGHLWAHSHNRSSASDYYQGTCLK